ncbi:MAG: class I SAM-dependent methyltransferase [Ktedonobacterales bacterium]
MQRRGQGSGTVQGQLWSAGANDWADVQEEQFMPLYKAGLARVGLAPGTRLLDIGCGAGLACQLAARRGARITGLDAAPGMLAIAASRLPEARFDRGDMQHLPYGNGIFDVVTGFNAFEYAADPAAALAEARRVTRRDGSVLIATWGRPEACQSAAYLTAIARLLPLPRPDARGTFAFSGAGALEALCTGAGLVPFAAETVACPWEYPDLETLLRGILAAGPHVRARSVVGESALRDAITAAVGPFARPDGSYHLANAFRFVIGRAA